MSKPDELSKTVLLEAKFDPTAEVLHAGIYTRQWFNEGLEEELSAEDWNSLVSLVEANFNWEGLSEAITDEFSIQYKTMKEGK